MLHAQLIVFGPPVRSTVGPRKLKCTYVTRHTSHVTCHTLHITLYNYSYLTQFLTDFGQILDSTSYDQA